MFEGEQRSATADNVLDVARSGQLRIATEVADCGPRKAPQVARCEAPRTMSAQLAGLVCAPRTLAIARSGFGAVVRHSAIGASRLGLRARLPPPPYPSRRSVWFRRRGQALGHRRFAPRPERRDFRRAGCSTSMNGRRDRQVGRDLEHYGIRSPGAA